MKILKRKVLTIICAIMMFIMTVSSDFTYAEVSDTHTEHSFDLTQSDFSDEAGGYIFLPEDYNAPTVDNNTEFVAYGLATEERYITGNLPSIRNQNPYGSCWAFSSISLAEIGIMKQEGITVDLSELHLAYFTYDSTADPLGLLNDENEYIGTTYNYLNKGGNYVLAYHALASWKGASKEETVPYSNAADSISNGIDSSLAFDSVAHLRNVYKVNINSNRDDVKNMIKEYGAVGVSYYDYDSDYSYTYNSYYAEEAYGSGHAVSIVGWDDTFPKENFNTEAPGDGAWLIRNSWGVDDYCRYGYFWMSYYNASLTDTAYVFDFVSCNSEEYYDNNYQYDGTIGSSWYSVNNGIKIANVFTTQKEVEELKAISFETETTNLEYTVNIYKGVEGNNPESGTLVSTTSGSTVYAGIHNVKLNVPVRLEQGDKYSVVITLNSSGDNVTFCVDTQITYNDWFSSNCSANAGESYYKYPMGSWNDLGSTSNTNIRIKAYTNTLNLVDISGAVVTVDTATYTGATLTPAVTVKYNGTTLSSDDYSVEYYNNVNAGSEAYVVVKGKGNYKGRITKYFTISPLSMSNTGITVNTISDQIYTGSAITPSVTVKYNGITLSASDYTVAYGNNINAGSSAYVIITGKGNFTGSVTKYFTITPLGLISSGITVSAISDQTYTGNAITPSVTVKYNGTTLSASDYTVAYGNNINAGSSAYVTITGKGNFTGSVTKYFIITPLGLSSSGITVSAISDQTYTGSAITPSVIVKYGSKVLTKNADYTVTYSNNVNAGTAIVTIIGTGNYTGEKKISFKINNPIPTSVTSATYSVSQQSCIISKITAGCTVGTLLSAVNEKNYCVITDGTNTLSSSTVLGTGMKLNLMNGSQLIKSYTIVVTGDTNGDGKINITDMIAVKQHILGKATLSGLRLAAGDVNGDGKINITDFIKIKASILGKDVITGITSK